MGTYTTIVAQKQVDGMWVTLEPYGLGFDPELPHHYGKLNMMSDLDDPEFFAANQRIHTVRQDFQSPLDYMEENEHAPWARRGLPDDITDIDVSEVFDLDYASTASWVTLDELLGYDFDEMKVEYYGQIKSWSEHLGKGYRLWFEKLREFGAERIIYCNS